MANSPLKPASERNKEAETVENNDESEEEEVKQN